MSLLRLENLSIGYKNKTVVENINLSFSKGEMLPIIGSNGVGKSTLLKTIIRQQEKISGDILFKNEKIQSYDQQDLSKLISITYPDHGLLHHYNVEEMVMLGRYPYSGHFGELDDKSKGKVKEALDLFGLDKISKNLFSKISSGQQQKAIIAKAFVQETEIMLLDEPTNYLDIKNRYEVLSLLSRLVKEHGRLILFSSHDIELCRRFCSEFIIFQMNGEVEKIKSDQFSFEKTFGPESF